MSTASRAALFCFGPPLLFGGQGPGGLQLPLALGLPLRRLPFGQLPRGGQELALQRVQGFAVRSFPLARRGQSRAAVEFPFLTAQARPLPRRLRSRITRPRCEFHGDPSLVPVPMKELRRWPRLEHSSAGPRSANCSRHWTPVGLQRDGNSPEPDGVLSERGALPESSRATVRPARSPPPGSFDSPPWREARSG